MTETQSKSFQTTGSKVLGGIAAFLLIVLPIWAWVLDKEVSWADIASLAVGVATIEFVLLSNIFGVAPKINQRKVLVVVAFLAMGIGAGLHLVDGNWVGAASWFVAAGATSIGLYLDPLDT